MQNTSNEKSEDKAEDLLLKLGLSKMTKLEKLAKSFSGVRSFIKQDNKNPDLGRIECRYSKYNQYGFGKSREEIEKVAEKVYNKDDYMIIVTTSDYGFDIIVWDNFVKRAFNDVLKKKN